MLLENVEDLGEVITAIGTAHCGARLVDRATPVGPEEWAGKACRFIHNRPNGGVVVRIPPRRTTRKERLALVKVDEDFLVRNVSPSEDRESFEECVGINDRALDPIAIFKGAARR